MEERLQKLLSAAGVASRRGAEELIRAGRVTVNGVPAGLGDRADPEKDVVCLDGRDVTAREEKVYLMLNKPRGYVTTLRDERGRKTVMDLVRDAGARVYPVGRLDMASEGLLLLTNDGDFANRLMHPSHEVEKEYLVRVTGRVDDALTVLLSPMELDGRPIRKPGVKVLEDRGDSGTLSVVIHEGRNRQVRRMCELAGLEVRRLTRVREGKLTLGDLPTGKWRPLSPQERELLFK